MTFKFWAKDYAMLIRQECRRSGVLSTLYFVLRAHYYYFYEVSMRIIGAW